MRIIYIPGLGEKPNIFDKIAPHIPGTDKLFLDNWELLGDIFKKETDVLQYAKLLVAKYNIGTQDVIIGHSMGGWIAYHIKHLVNCRIIQIASWTDSKKIVRPTSNLSIIYFLTKSGLYFNRLIQQLTLLKSYKGKASAPIFMESFDRVRTGNSNNVLNQLNIVFKPMNTIVTVTPDMRIHATGDALVLVPSEPFVEVPGDHFCLYTHPQDVYLPIIEFLSQQ